MIIPAIHYHHRSCLVAVLDRNFPSEWICIYQTRRFALEVRHTPTTVLRIPYFLQVLYWLAPSTSTFPSLRTGCLRTSHHWINPSQFAEPQEYILSQPFASAPLRLSWPILLEARIARATDPSRLPPATELCGVRLQPGRGDRTFCISGMCTTISGYVRSLSSVVGMRQRGFECGPRMGVFASAFRALQQVAGDLRDEHGIR